MITVEDILVENRKLHEENIRLRKERAELQRDYSKVIGELCSSRDLAAHRNMLLHCATGGKTGGKTDN